MINKLIIIIPCYIILFSSTTVVAVSLKGSKTNFQKSNPADTNIDTTIRRGIYLGLYAGYGLVNTNFNGIDNNKNIEALNPPNWYSQISAEMFLGFSNKLLLSFFYSTTPFLHSGSIDIIGGAINYKLFSTKWKLLKTFYFSTGFVHESLSLDILSINGENTVTNYMFDPSITVVFFKLPKNKNIDFTIKGGYRMPMGRNNWEWGNTQQMSSPNVNLGGAYITLGIGGLGCL